jgi:hypothetical protein
VPLRTGHAGLERDGAVTCQELGIDLDAPEQRHLAVRPLLVEEIDEADLGLGLLQAAGEGAIQYVVGIVQLGDPERASVEQAERPLEPRRIPGTGVHELSLSIMSTTRP